MPHSFSTLLKAARLESGVTQQAAAAQMEIPLRTFEKWESGDREPPSYVQRFVLNELKKISIIK